jgi:hypothetical protein
MHDHIVEWSPFACPLKLDTIDDCPRQASWLGAGEDREDVGGADLRFEMGNGTRRNQSMRANATRRRLIAVAQR